jgi:hypothetical protein
MVSGEGYDLILKLERESPVNILDWIRSLILYLNKEYKLGTNRLL